MINREQALALLNEPGPEKHLIQHALASEAVMRALARHLGEDEEVWGLTGLLHDLDYPLTHDDPAKHGLVGAERIGDRLPEEALHAIRAHNGEMTGVAPSSAFDYALRWRGNRDRACGHGGTRAPHGHGRHAGLQPQEKDERQSVCRQRQP